MRADKSASHLDADFGGAPTVLDRAFGSYRIGRDAQLVPPIGCGFNERRYVMMAATSASLMLL